MANLGYLQLTRRCVQRCRFCSNPPSGVELTEPEMRAEIDSLIELGYDGVILTGGEPTCSELLLPALDHATRRGLPCRLITNGQLLADRDLFARCAAAGLSHIHVSIHSHRPEVHELCTRTPGAFQRLLACLRLAPELGVVADVNTVINTYNADHLHLMVRWLASELPSIRHFVFNNMDPVGNRAAENPDCIPRQHELVVSLELAMDFLQKSGRTFRAERVPLCFMRRFAWASTETRKIIKEEERCIRFLDQKGLVRQQEFLHGKGEACDVCRWDPICAGMYALATVYDERVLSPIFDDPHDVVRAVLARPPPPALMERLMARRGRRSLTEQPSDEERAAARARLPSPHLGF